MFIPKTVLTAFSIILLTSGFSLADSGPAVTDSGYYTIGKIVTTVREIDNASEAKPDPMPVSGGGKAIAAAGAVINTGATAWNVINSGQAASDLNHYYASAVPGFGQWGNYVGWKGPKEAIYQIRFENLYGGTMVDLQYVVSFFYGGHDKDGKGRYITNFTVKPVRFNIMWGCKFMMGIKISDPMNLATPEDGLGYLQADMTWNFSTPFTNERGFATYAVYGDGGFKDLTRDTSGEAGLPEPDIKDVKVNWD